MHTGTIPPPELSEYSWRPIQPTDIPAIKEMTAAAVEIDHTEGAATGESLSQIFGLLGDRVESNTLAAITPDGTIAALALILTRPTEDEFIAMIEGMVHVGHRGRGLGSYILAWMEGRAREEFDQSDQGLPLVIRTSCADHQTDRIRLFEQNGFEAVRYAYKMRRQLPQPIPEKSLPHGLRLIQWNESLDLPLMQAFNEAFRGHWGLPHMDEELWQQFFTGVPQFRADLSYLAMAGETIAGFCINWVDQTKNEQTGVQEGWIEAVGVIPGWRGQGVASALIVHALREFLAAGMERAALDVDTQNPTGALRLYENLGFEATNRTITFSKIVHTGE